MLASTFLKLSQLLRVLLHIGKLILEIALSIDEAMLVNVGLDDLLIEQGVARWTKPWLRVQNDLD